MHPARISRPQRTELRTVYGAIIKEHPEAYPARSDFRIDATLLRDQIVSPARTVLLLLLAAAALIFVIACSNVANLILARSVRREGELALRAALGASASALRRTLLAESLLLCGIGATLGVIIAQWMVPILGRYASRFSVRALDVTVDSSVLWVGVGLAMLAAVLLAFVPRLPSADAAGGLGLSSGSVRITSSTNRRLRLFAVTQIAASFVLLAGASMLLTTLIALQRTRTGFETRQVLAVNGAGDVFRTDSRIRSSAFYQDVMRQVEPTARRRSRVAADRGCPGGMGAIRSADNSRSKGTTGPTVRMIRAPAGALCRRDSSPRLTCRSLPAATSLTDDEHNSERPVIVSQSLAQRMFPSVEARPQPRTHVDRLELPAVRRRQWRNRGASWASPRTSTTRTSCRARR